MQITSNPLHLYTIQSKAANRKYSKNRRLTRDEKKTSMLLSVQKKKNMTPVQVRHPQKVKKRKDRGERKDNLGS
jgi:hypothetical protein